uniref:Uncharacterized protein n=1 Tax=Meloidogyne enterolobii TaxID=390850 RepID=A0A6V7XD00_MELEN|nr:unnamed protein product [Meloidogyne enterolobii]
MGIDTREHFLNTTPIQHFRQVSFVLRSSVLLNQRLRIALNLNEHLLSGGENKNEAQLFDKTAIQSEKDMEVIRLSDVENCFYQGFDFCGFFLILWFFDMSMRIIFKNADLRIFVVS